MLLTLFILNRNGRKDCSITTLNLLIETRGVFHLQHIDMLDLKENLLHSKFKILHQSIQEFLWKTQASLTKRWVGSTFPDRTQIHNVIDATAVAGWTSEITFSEKGTKITT